MKLLSNQLTDMLKYKILNKLAEENNCSLNDITEIPKELYQEFNFRMNFRG